MSLYASLPKDEIAKQLPDYAPQPLFFNQSQFREDLCQKPVVGVFKNAISGVDLHLRDRFFEGNSVRQLVAERALFTDLILHYAWHQFNWKDDIALIAVGGYGRGELHPKSDLDILILLDDTAGEKYNENLEKFVAFLWDIGLEVGSSVRTMSECLAIAKEDITVATNVLECRRLAGNDKLRDELQIRTDPYHMWPISEFYQAKWAEQKERHRKNNDTEYNLEPNIKNAPGGLRDLQMITWVAKRYYAVQTLKQLVGKDFFTDHEFAILRNSEEYLWKVRFGLHIITNRAEERLLFEYQRELAKIFGYEDNEKGLAVEQFMHDYYRTVSALAELNDVLLQYLDESIHERHKREKYRKINNRFQLRDNYIEVTRNTVFDETPSALLEIFLIMGRNPSIFGVRGSTIRLIRERRWLIDENFRKDPENNRLFMELFSLGYGLVSQLTRMKRYGILSRYLPEFGKIVGQMQHDLFHRYTVDAHTILVIRNMRRFTYPEEEKLFPVAAHIMKRLPKPELLYIAGLFHDIGKGRGGDHSVIGAQEVILFCEQHGLSNRETRLISWLVEKHLLMSYVSQKQDITDPEVIHNFALQMGDQMHLDYLYALTVADMCGTNPEIWNTWRASLMRQLYLETKRALRRGLENTIDKQEVISETQQLALLKLQDKGINEQEARSLWDVMSDEYFIRENHIDIAWHTEAMATHNSPDPLIIIKQTSSLAFKGATQIFIRWKNSQHVFSAATNNLANQGLIIQDAKIYSSNDGYTLDTFYVLDENYEPLPNDPTTYSKIAKSLKDELMLIGDYSNTIRRRTPRELKQFSIPTSTRISNDIGNNYTVLEVITPDRPGLLASIARIFMEFNIEVQNAKISTLGERTEDIFFITTAEGTPLSDPDLCIALQEKICARLDRQVKKELHT
ncbi:[protein-PII] uridylyltransferase [Teredinibacter sp. KSP-S5-2]|uniref:[protein-PII] uridylyltransferase n=1 Tax=Teredinibacter sp. KSP-S5-2 TaxID=3034506 RepID=UPI00293450EA|nr:[protein-PII] uridylyltransferase [Teredinibacter sp. KSP-S5-2]WNO09821.1 [protein-PII] uridylyltransferase [Teredinibacter sp. KSP-S5-2]